MLTSILSAAIFRRVVFTTLGACFVTVAGLSQAESIINITPTQGSLQTAISDVPDGGVIELAAGIYNAPSGGWTIFPDLSGGTKGFTIRAASGASVTLDGGGTTEIFTFTTPKPVNFQGLTFTNGVSTREFHGGAMSLDHVQATFALCTFRNNAGNAPTTGGGGLWIYSSTVSFQSCIWDGNISKNYAGAFLAAESRIYIRDSRFVGNRTNLPGHSEFSGGGAFHANRCVMRVDNSRFENNQAGYVGGAIYALGSFTDSVTGPVMDLEMNNCLFTGNFVLRDPNGTFTAPTAGGAIQLEGQTRGRFYNCRFINNVAKQGGAVASYRTDNQFQGCVFQNNRATGTAGPDGFGGSIFVISGDLSDSSTVNGTVNRPSGNLSLTDCLFRGPGGGVPSARQGGAIFIGGDLNAMYGDGVQKNGTLEKNRSNVNLKRVVFADLATSDSGNGTGGAMTADFVNLTADQSIVQNCSTTEYGGAFEIIHGSVVNITNTTFVQNRARLLGAVLTMFGGTLNLDGCKFSDNQLTGGGNGGTAIYAVPDRGAGILPPFEMTGTVKNCLFNSLAGYTIYDSDQNPASAPFNRLQYNANQVFPGDRTAYFNDLVGGLVIAQFNSLILSRADGTTSVKSTVANTALASPGTSGAILMVPPTVLSSGAPGETLPIPSYLAYAASGGTPSLDGAAQGTSYGVTQTSLNGIHTLTVGSKSFTTVPPAGVALNISTRLPVGIGQNVLIGGFIIQGPMPKTVILRAIGPSLPLAGTLQDPVLELHNASGATIASNDNWRSTDLGGLLTSGQSIDLIASTVPPSNDAESAILVTLNPGAYTAVVRGANNTTGIAVVEGYDLDADKTSTLANISTRGLVQTGDNVMIGGFIFGGGSAQTNVVVRGIGPSLAAFGINNTLSDPVLELHDANGRLVDANDDWKTNQAAIQATGLQPSNDAESAILVTNLAPGGYTAVLQGKSGGTGVGVVEVYVF